ncbi:MAG: ATP-binding protein [Bacteroidetes bacterium]|nr:ATP-binding protein [Bacteroidota bacterium]
MNPFTLNYQPKYFCDRVSETRQLHEYAINELNTLLHSPRRLGKSALIRHLFHQYEQSDTFETIFVDLFATRDMEGLIRSFAEKLLDKYHKKNLLSGIKILLKGLSPTLTFSREGSPKLGLSINESQQETTLHDLLMYLEKLKKKVIVAFDEFQEIASYPEKAEAILRTHMQELNNVHFIFSGSSNHLLKDMFFSAKRPFYQSTEVIVLDKINRNIYADHISALFSQFNKKIDTEAVNHLLDFSEVYTYYTQVICNQAFYKTDDVLDLEQAMLITESYLENRKSDFHSLFNLLPENQKRVAIAIANKGTVSSPTGIDFLLYYKLPSVSSTLQAVNTLINKEILYRTPDGYVIYDVFFRRFLEMYYRQ